MVSQKIKILYFTCVSVICTLIVLIIEKYETLPTNITTHINTNGEPDLFGNKISLLYMLAINIFLILIFGFFIKYPKYAKYNVEITELNKKEAYERMQLFYIICSFVITAVFSYMTFKTLNLGTTFYFLLAFLVISPILILLYFKDK